MLRVQGQEFWGFALERRCSHLLRGGWSCWDELHDARLGFPVLAADSRRLEVMVDGLPPLWEVPTGSRHHLGVCHALRWYST